MKKPRMVLAMRLLAGGLVLAAAGVVSVAHALPFPEARVGERRAGTAPSLLDREGRPIDWRVGRDDLWRLPADLRTVSPWVVGATVAVEDQRFWSHRGVDPLAVGRAALQNLAGGRRVSGASTLTMQAVRLLWPSERTWAAKLRESALAWKFERSSSKDEILDTYFELAPYGGNVSGIEAAARRHFGKRAAELTLGEAALLAGVPQSPSRLNPAKRLEAALARRETVFRRMEELGFANAEEIERARREFTAIRTAPRRADAARFAEFVLAARPGLEGERRTTLDPRAQDAAAVVVAEHGARLGATGVDGMAAVVVDVGASALRAMIGSADPGDPRHGKLNAATVRRQPGSALKPFLFAAAFDAGILTPSSLVDDGPGNWSGYCPENMDREFRGSIPAWQALRESRNLPAVRVLERVGAERLEGDLNRLGLGVAGAGGECGLSLALGTAEVRLVDLANAYAALGRLGECRPLRVLEDEPEGPRSQVYSRGAAWLALRAMGASGPGEAGRPVCKTGTSWNHRDAWAVALSPDFVVAVWCGRMSGEGHPALTGAAAALPAAVEILERLAGAMHRAWERPPGVAKRCVCAVSGAPPTHSCVRAVDAEYLPGTSADLPCAVCANRPAPAPRASARPRGENGAAPATAAVARKALEILSPLDGAEYVIAGGSGRELELHAGSSAPGVRLHWFLDGELVAVANGGECARWQMEPGRHELTVSDGAGASGRAAFSVR